MAGSDKLEIRSRSYEELLFIDVIPWFIPNLPKIF